MLKRIHGTILLKKYFSTKRFCISLWSNKRIQQNTQAKSNDLNKSKEFQNPAQLNIKRLFTHKGSEFIIVLLQFCKANNIH